MNYHREWEGDADALSEFDLAGSSEPPEEGDPEEALAEEEGTVPDEADPVDAAEQLIEIPLEDDEPRGG
ncbi:hypothetical protein [Glycomyces sp. NRRL B-16210]|uniref:hypothetical protein n=1 Tax=Glycomyces sp. NRRL B-16210 TaxID=1463821 RepID=UPI0004C0FC4D|nr:hypothetical protein [Glycomyces sp. NRRL B-16210]